MHRKIKKLLTKSNFKKHFKKQWWLWIIIVLCAAYVINGVVFSVIIYKNYPAQMPCKTVNENQVCKKYPYEQNTTRFMTKIYPFVAVWVDWSPIWVKDYYDQLGYVKHFSYKTQQEIPDDSVIKKQVFDQMIDTKLLEVTAKRNKIKVTDQDIDETYNKLAEQNGGKEEVNKVLNELYGMTEKDFKNLIKDQLLREKIQKELFVQVRAKHILIKDEAKAKEVLEEVKKGEKSFDDLAKEYSEDTGSRDNGGDLNWFGRGMMVPEFEAAAFSLEPGQVKEELVKSEFGFHIIKVEEKKGQIDEVYIDWFNNLKDKSKIYKWVKTQNTGSQEDSNNIVNPETASTDSPVDNNPTDNSAPTDISSPEGQ